MSASLRGSEGSEASERETGMATATEAASAMLLPLSNAWIYLGTLANTWLALGEKLRNSFGFCTGSGSFGSSSSTSNSNGSPALFRTTPHNANYSEDTSSRTEVGAVALDSDIRDISQGGQLRQQQKLQHQPHRHSKQHSNRLEFSIADFLAVHLWRSKRSPQPSPSSIVESTTANQPCPDSRFSSEEPSHGADGSAWSNFWPLCLRLGGIRNASPAGGIMERSFPPQPPSQRRASSEPSRTISTDKTLVLDLDETLIHAQRELAPDGRFDFMVILPPKQHSCVPKKTTESLALCAGRETSAAPSAVGQEAASGEKCTEINEGLPAMQRPGSSVGHTTDYGGEDGRRIYVRKRPHLRYFLETVSRQFEVIVFTAARADFANAVLEEIDPGRRMVDHVLSRESCTRLSKSHISGDSGGGEVGGGGKKSIGSWGGLRRRGVAASSSASSKRRTVMVKDLSILGRPLSKVSLLLGEWLLSVVLSVPAVALQPSYVFCSLTSRRSILNQDSGSCLF